MDLNPLDPLDEGLLSNLLEQRYGDGSIYLHNAQDRHLLKRARSLGLVCADGYITSAGLDFVNSRSFRLNALRSVERENDSDSDHELLGRSAS